MTSHCNNTYANFTIGRKKEKEKNLLEKFISFVFIIDLIKCFSNLSNLFKDSTILDYLHHLNGFTLSFQLLYPIILIS